MTDIAIVGDWSESFRFSAIGAEVIGVPPRDVYLSIVEKTTAFHKASPWILGDLVNHGFRLYGEEFSQALDSYGEQTLKNYSSVASAFEPRRRRPSLSYSHHAEVRSLSAEEQDRLLEEAERNQWNRDELRDEARRVKGAIVAAPQRPQLAPVVTPSTAGGTAGEPVPMRSDADTASADRVTPDGIVGEGGEEFTWDALVAGLEESQERILRQQRTIESLQKDDLAAEILIWEEKYYRLEGRLNGAINEANEAIRFAKARGNMLDRIRKAVGVPAGANLVTAVDELARRASVTTATSAPDEKITRAHARILDQLRSVIGVDTNSELVPAVQDLLR